MNIRRRNNNSGIDGASDDSVVWLSRILNGLHTSRGYGSLIGISLLLVCVSFISGRSFSSAVISSTSSLRDGSTESKDRRATSVVDVEPIDMDLEVDIAKDINDAMAARIADSSSDKAAETSSRESSDQRKKQRKRLKRQAEEDPFDTNSGRPLTNVVPTETIESSPTSACSCYNATTDCCERRIHPNHKFGHELVVSLFAPGSIYYRNEITNKLTGRYAAIPDYFNRKTDYREVFVTRNWFDAIVSGYLYHRDGHECWIDPYGNPMSTENQWKLANPDFMDLVKLSAPHPPGNGRNLCKYLAEESDEDGLRTYAEYIIRKFYFRTVTIYNAVQAYEKEQRKTLFVCFEDLGAPTTKMTTAHKIMDWLYPGGQNSYLPPPPADAVEEEGYHGGHATSHDATLRTKLRNIVIQLDQQVFGNAIARYSDIFGCGGTSNSTGTAAVAAATTEALRKR